MIFGINYWPEQLGIAPYTTGLAEHLVDRGHAVTVVTGFPHYPQWQLETDHRRRLSTRESINGVNVIRRRHHVPDRPTAARRGVYEATFAVHGLTSLLESKPDIVLGISPSVSGAVLARIASTRFRVPYGIWFQDLAGRAASQSGIQGGNKVARFVDQLESQAARNATVVGVISDGFRPTLAQMNVDPTRIRKLRNWSHIAKPSLTKAAARAYFGLPDDAFICLHAGNMGQKQGLENIIDTAKIAVRASDSPLFVLQGDGNTRADLERCAAGLPNVRFLPPQPDADFPNALAAADVLLVNQKPTITDMCLPGKLTSYFAANRPVIAAVNESSETAHELEQANAGLVISAGKPEHLLQAIKRLRLDPALADTLARNGRHFAETTLSESSALAKLDEFVATIRLRQFQPRQESPRTAPGPAD